MPLKSDTLRPPRGLSRLLFRLPIWLYRLGLGWLLGQRFLLLNHTGRKSGRVRQTVLEVAGHDEESDTYLVAAGFGPRSDWYRNLLKRPEVTIQVGRRRLPVVAELLSAAESGEEMVDYARRHPTAVRALSRALGFEADSEADYRKLGQESVPFVAFRPRESSVSVSKADWFSGN